MRLADSLRSGLLVAALWAFPWMLSGATITVTSLTDITTNDGQVTLREAILAANSDSSVDGSVAGSGPDEIVFATGPGAITLNGTPLPTITQALTITGPGSADLAVDASSLSRVFHIASGANVQISGLTVSTGLASASDGGGIVNEGTLTLSEVTLSDNLAVGGKGGAIHNKGALQMTASIVTGNSALNGGGIFNAYQATLTMTDCTVTNNSSNGIYGGGGLLNENGVLIVRSSTIFDNYAVSGGGVASSGGYSVVTVVNTTFSGNGVTNGGGAILNFGGSWTITHSTISENRANSDNDLSGVGGGISFLSGALVLKNTIVAGNFNGSGTTPDDINGPVGPTSSYNIIGVDTRLTGISNGTNGNQIGTAAAPIDPLLGFLQDNEGLTFTHELLSGSPALDAGVFLPSVAVDQRGITRPQGSDPDVGSFELFVPTTVPEDLDLQYMSLDSQTYEACNSISAAPSAFVGSSAAVSFRAGNFVVLRDGFAVLSGGEFVVVLLPPTGC